MHDVEIAAIRAAKSGNPDPPGDLLDGYLYLALYALYTAYYAGQVTRDYAADAKRRFYGMYEQQQTEHKHAARCWDHACKLWNRIDSAAAAYRKEKTIDNADRLYSAIYYGR